MELKIQKLVEKYTNMINDCELSKKDFQIDDFSAINEYNTVIFTLKKVKMDLEELLK